MKTGKTDIFFFSLHSPIEEARRMEHNGRSI